MTTATHIHVAEGATVNLNITLPEEEPVVLLDPRGSEMPNAPDD